MRQDQITIGADYRVKVGSRLATVTVQSSRRATHWGKPRTVFVCVTHDTRRAIEATAARLRPLPGAAVPASPSAVIDAERRARREQRIAEAAEAAALEVYYRAALAFTPHWTAEGLRDHAESWLERLPSEGARVDARAAILRALAADPGMAATDCGWPDIVAAGRRASMGGAITRPSIPRCDDLPRCNPDRLVELPVGSNLDAVRQIVNRRHVAEPLLTVARVVFSRLGRHGSRRLPVPARRGLWLAVATIHANNRATYRMVMRQEPTPTEEMIGRRILASR